MDLHFKITQEEYLLTVETLLRDRRKSILNIVLFLLMTFGQLGFILWHISTVPQTNAMKILLLIMAVSICALQLFYQFGLKIRARSQMERDMRKGRIHADFWKAQHLVLKDDLLSLKCGKSELRYDCAYYGKAQEIGNMLVLNFTRGKEIHQLMIPLSAFKEMGTASFIHALEEAKKDSIRSALEENRAVRPEGADFSVVFSYSYEAFCRDQVRAARYAYGCRMGWTIGNIVRIFAAVYLLYYACSDPGTTLGWFIFCCAVVILLLYPLIVAFTPLCKVLVRNNIRSLMGGLDQIECSLDVADDKLYYIGDSFDNVIDLKKIYAVVKAKDLTILYLKDNTAITIPYGTSEDHATLRMALYLETRADINWRNRGRKEKLH